MNQPVVSKVFHPSLFEVTVAPSLDERTLLSIRKQRDQRLPKQDVENLTSPGGYKLTVDDKGLAQSNTNSMFKNLYGETLLTRLFFSESNIKNIQKVVRFLVHKETQYVIDEQSYSELLIIMRSMFLEHSAHPPLFDNDMSEERQKQLRAMYSKEVSRLNEIVITEIVPKVVSQLHQYVSYLQDASRQPYYMENPTNESTAGKRQYRSVTQVLFGGEL